MITDLTYATGPKRNGIIHENYIFEEVYNMIEEAEDFVVVDFFLG